ncbi:short chain dehydrogenase [Plesiocystis pacifica SIR-1]|uniref:Short chain dehydrogenase n=1 Tax=Plesiocystis pacifica SIR-1 TaxID=391625 RepID=A6GB68_9BACT|nr:septum formation initiator family protein [Plesiocystis pacifica]EDM76865.1 short chain dehydrogenase [Plesiocystis pacifica SIR-1]
MTWLNRILLALFITAAIAFLPSYEHLGAEDLARVRAERDALVEGNEDLRAEIRLLEAEVDALHRNPEDPSSSGRVDRELARIAREDLNMILPGELVFEVHRPADADPTSKPSPKPFHAGSTEH